MSKGFGPADFSTKKLRQNNGLEKDCDSTQWLASRSLQGRPASNHDSTSQFTSTPAVADSS